MWPKWHQGRHVCLELNPHKGLRKEVGSVLVRGNVCDCNKAPLDLLAGIMIVDFHMFAGAVFYRALRHSNRSFVVTI